MQILKNSALDLIFKRFFKYDLHFKGFLCVSDGLYTHRYLITTLILYQSMYILDVKKVENTFSYNSIFFSTSICPWHQKEETEG